MQLADGRILITESTVLEEKDKLTLLNAGNPTANYILYPSAKGWKRQSVSVEEVETNVEWKKIGGRHISVKPQIGNHPQVNDYILQIDYTGDVGMAFIGNDLVLDHFWHGKTWDIGMDRFSKSLEKHGAMNFYFRPISKDAPFIEMGGIPQEYLPDFSKENNIFSINSIKLIPEYKIEVNAE
jgi:hypothetical protein